MRLSVKYKLKNKMDSGIPWQTFMDNIKAIKEFSDKIGDEWQLFGDPEQEGGAYLFKRIVMTFDKFGVRTNSQCIENDETISEDILIYEFHIAYKITYAAPVLYYNAWNLDGELVSLPSIWKRFHPDYIKGDMYSVLTQSDHPVSGIPFFMLHPCKTTDLLKTFLTTSNNVVVSWLSAVAPAVQLPLSEKYITLTTPLSSS